MKTFIYYYEEDNKTFGINLKAQDYTEAFEIARYTKMRLIGKKISEVEIEDNEVKKYFKLSQYERNFRNWFNSLGE